MASNQAQTAWTTERVALLKKGIEAGLTCAEIAREIGLSRNAVIGKANRLGLSRGRGAPTGERSSGRKSPRGTANRQAIRALWTEPEPPAEPPSESGSRRSLFELAQWHCRWPLGEPGTEEFGFCGNKPVDGLPYCPGHARMAYRHPARIPHNHDERATPAPHAVAVAAGRALAAR
jgi:GcrA cell cycle regulator